MLWPFQKRPTPPTLGAADAQLSQLLDRLAVLERRVSDLDSGVIDTKQDHRKLRMEWGNTLADLAGLSDKLSRQLKRITTRAAGAPAGPRSDEPEFPDLGEPEGEDRAVEAIVARMKAR